MQRNVQHSLQFANKPLKYRHFHWGSGKRRERWCVSWQDGMQQVILPRVYNQLYIYNSGETTSSSIPFPRISTTMCNREQNHRVCYGGSQDVHKYLWGVVLQQCEMNGRTKRRGGGSAGMNSDHLYIYNCPHARE